MKKFLAVMLLGLTLVTSSMDADAARRFGGGASFGRSTPAFKQATPAPTKPALNQKAQPNQAAKPAAAGAAAAAKPASPLRGMLMGAAAALGIAGLLSALGLSSSFAEGLMMVLFAVAAFFVIRMVLGLLLNKKLSTASASRTSANTMNGTTHFENASSQQGFKETGAGSQTSVGSQGSVMDAFSGGVSTPQAASLSIPDGFDVRGFETVAKENFLKLQRAWDSGNVVEISDFTTNELFIAVTHQLRERGNVAQASEVIDLTVKLMGMTSEDQDYVAVVNFKGAMKIAGEFEEVNENWVLTRPLDETQGWLLAGIEQVEA